MLTMRMTPKMRLRPAAMRKRTEAYSNEFSIWIARIDNDGPLSKPAPPRLHAAAAAPRLGTVATLHRETPRARSRRARRLVIPPLQGEGGPPSVARRVGWGSPHPGSLR